MTIFKNLSNAPIGRHGAPAVAGVVGDIGFGDAWVERISQIDVVLRPGDRRGHR